MNGRFNPPRLNEQDVARIKNQRQKAADERKNVIGETFSVRIDGENVADIDAGNQNTWRRTVKADIDAQLLEIYKNGKTLVAVYMLPDSEELAPHEKETTWLKLSKRQKLKLEIYIEDLGSDEKEFSISCVYAPSVGHSVSKVLRGFIPGAAAINPQVDFDSSGFAFLNLISLKYASILLLLFSAAGAAFFLFISSQPYLVANIKPPSIVSPPPPFTNRVAAAVPPVVASSRQMPEQTESIPVPRQKRNSDKPAEQNSDFEYASREYASRSLPRSPLISFLGTNNTRVFRRSLRTPSRLNFIYPKSVENTPSVSISLTETKNTIEPENLNTPESMKVSDFITPRPKNNKFICINRSP